MGEVPLFNAGVNQNVEGVYIRGDCLLIHICQIFECVEVWLVH